MTMIEIEETLNALPFQARQEVMDFMEFVAKKYLQKKSHPQKSLKKKVLDYAGAWKDMDESDYQSFLKEIAERRVQLSTIRRDI